MTSSASNSHEFLIYMLLFYEKKKLNIVRARILIIKINTGSIFIFDQIFRPPLRTSTVADCNQTNFTKAYKYNDMSSI